MIQKHDTILWHLTRLILTPMGPVDTKSWPGGEGRTTITVIQLRCRGGDNPINAPQLSSLAWHFPLWVFIISHKFRQFPLSSIFIRLVLPTTIRSCSNSHHNHHHLLPIFSCNMKIHNFCFLTVFFPIVSKSAYTLIGYFRFRSTNFEKRAVIHCV